jgi:hypothetical protein
MIQDKWGGSTLTSYLSKSRLLVVQKLPKWGGMIQEGLPRLKKCSKIKVLRIE